MARWLKHTGCVECGSRDNLGVYDDGSSFCFGCHAFTKPSGADRLKEFAAHRLYNNYEPVDNLGLSRINLPLDYGVVLPAWGHNWLSQYLTPMEMAENLIGYSKNFDRIIFPVYDRAMRLLIWTGRAKEGKDPKYLTMGPRNEALDVISANILSDRVVAVEDRVSAIVVSRVCSSIALFGSKMPVEWAESLSAAFSTLVLWLDPDKKTEALKQAIKLGPFFRNGVKVIFSDGDPKEYDAKEVSWYLGKA